MNSTIAVTKSGFFRMPQAAKEVALPLALVITVVVTFLGGAAWINKEQQTTREMNAAQVQKLSQEISHISSRLHTLEASRFTVANGLELWKEIAIIKVEGMTYQPPLIGSKKLLNFRAKSWPSGGGIAITLGAVLVALAMFDSRKKRAASALLLAMVASSCAPAGPRPIALGEDQCHFCKMEITDARFGAQVVMNTGRIHVFDSVECLAAFVGSAPSESVGSVWVADVAAPATFVRAEEAGYLLDGTLRGPMGRAVSFATPAAATGEGLKTGGVPVSWQALVADSAAILSHGGE